MQTCWLDEVLPADHQVRTVWAVAEKLDLSKFEEPLKARGSDPGRSTTDPDARVMKMPDHGFRPAYNVRFVVDPGRRAIVGADVTRARTDTKEAEPLREQVERRTGQKVEEPLVDGGYVPKDRIEQAEARGTRKYAPVPNGRKDPKAYAVKKTDGPGVAAWRQRMGSEEGKEIYSQRGSTVETVNADLKMFRGLSRIMVRGLKRVRNQVLWSAQAYHLLHFAKAWMT
jgi:hypothetical protein